MSVTDSILQTIDYAIEKRTKHLMDMDVGGVIAGINKDDTYQVKINDAEYKISNGSGIAFKQGDLVWVHSPNGDFNRKFIISSRTSNSKKYVNQSNSEYGEGGGGISPSDIITDREIDEMFM